MVSSLLAGIPFSSSIDRGRLMPQWLTRRKTPKVVVGGVAGFSSEWWPASNRNPGRLPVGNPGRIESESSSEEFIEWASHYDDGSREGRNRRRHEAWLARLPCPVLRLDGTRPTAALVDEVARALGIRSPHDAHRNAGPP
jgi:hypothetical protein